MFKLLFIAVLLVGLSRAANSGVKVGLNKQALDYAARKAVDIMAREVPKIRLPNFSKKGYSVYNTRITRFTKPSASVSINPGSGLTVTLSRGALGVSARWKKKVWFFWLKGNIAASSTSISLRVGTGISTRNGRPKFNARSCSASLGGFKVKTSGSLSAWIINLFIGFFKGTIRRTLESEVCKQIVRVINVNANRELATLNLVAPINRYIKLNYYLTGNPTFLPNRIESSHNGKALYDPQSSFNPPQMSLLPGRMISISLSENTFNSIGRVLHRRRLFRYNYKIKHSVIRRLFNVGSINANIYLASAPTISISSSGAVVKATVEAVLSAPGKYLKVRAQVSAQTRVYVSGDRIRGYVTRIQSRVQSVQPNNPLITSLLNQLLQILERTIKPAINRRLIQGMPLPKVKDVRFTSPRITLANKQIKLATNVV